MTVLEEIVEEEIPDAREKPALLHERENLAAVTLDECWSLEVWGADEEAEAKLAHRRTDFLIAAKVAER